MPALGLAFLSRRRHRRNPATARSGRPAQRADQQPTEPAISAASDVPLLRWARHHLATLFSDQPRHLEGGPLAAELSLETGIELLWNTPNPAAPRPWTAADGGWAWHLPYDPDDPVLVTLDDDPAGILGLVMIGSRQGRRLLINIEAFGSISLDGDPAHVTDLATAITTGLGGHNELSSAEVLVIGLDLPGTDHLHRATTATAASALEVLSNTTSAFSDTTEPDRTAKARTNVVVIVAAVDAAAPSLIEASPACRGVATILVGPAPDAAARITIDSDGQAELEPLGIRFQAAGPPIPPAANPQLADPRDQPIRSDSPTSDTDRQPHTPSTDTMQRQRPPHSDDCTRAFALTDPPTDPNHEKPGLDGTSDEPAPPEILVKVLGRPHVPTRLNLRRRQLALVVYLASKGKPTPAGSVQHAVWGGRSVQTKTMWNVATATRAALGQLADGRAAMPPSERAHNTLALAPEVRTDLQVLEDLYNAAQHAPSSKAIDLLARGLNLIEGQPFDSADCEWAHHTELLVAHANRLIEEAVELLVDLATTAGRPDLARHAITQGLRALPGNEVLYRTRMTLEHDHGNLAAVHAAYTELQTYLTGIDTEPSPATTDLYRRLRPQPRRHAS